jgi:hypothetical protein
LENVTLTKVSVKVQFVNGTAVAGASVSASVVGVSYPVYGPDLDLKMCAQTGTDGVAHLVVPSLPVEVTAWDWIRVNLPANITTIPVNIGGETINVTVIWEPIYVGLAGSALIIPPQNSTTITLHIQEPSFWYESTDTTPGAATPQVISAPTSSSSIGTISNTATGVPAYLSSLSSTSSSDISASAPTIQTQISPITITPSPEVVTSGNGNTFLPVTFGAIIVLAIAVVGFGLVVSRRRKTA